MDLANDVDGLDSKKLTKQRVHRLRVMLRRLDTVSPDKVFLRARKELVALRNADVFAAILKSTALEMPFYQELKKNLAKKRKRELGDVNLKLLGRVQAASKKMKVPTADTMFEGARGTVEKIIEKTEAALADSVNLDTLHKSRLLIKKMRYLIEFSHKAPQDPIHAVLRELQKIIGEAHDTHELALYLQKKSVRKLFRGKKAKVFKFYRQNMLKALKGFSRDFKNRWPEYRQKIIDWKDPQPVAGQYLN